MANNHCFLFTKNLKISRCVKMKKEQTLTASIYKDNDDITNIVFLPENTVKYSEMVDNFRAIKDQYSKKKYLLLIHVNVPNLKFEKEAQHFFESKMTKRVNSAVAILTSENTTAELKTFFNALEDSKVPTNVFFEHESAVTWLKSFKEN